MRQELETLKEAQSGHNPMDVSLTDNNSDLNSERAKKRSKKNVN